MGQGGGQGGVDGRGHQRAVWEQQGIHCWLGLIWLVTRGGEAWGVWAREVGKGGVDGGGAPESSVGATRRSLVPPFGLR